MKKNIIIHQARPEEEQLVHNILRETALWLRSIGSTQWGDILKGQDNHDMSGAIVRGEVYYATVAGQPAGVFILWNTQSQWDEMLWGKEEGWMYLHRLAIIRQYAGTELSSKLIQSAKEIAARKQMKGVRLDCMTERENLNHLYEEAFFTFVKKVSDWDTGEEKADFNLYQYTL